MCHSDINVWPRFHEQLMTSSKGQSVADWIDRSELQDSFITLSIIFIRDKQNGPIFSGRSRTQEMVRKWKWFRWWWVWVANFKYDANQEALIEQKGALAEEEGEPRTPSQSTSKIGEDVESTDEECCGSNNHVTIESQHQEERKSLSC